MLQFDWLNEYCTPYIRPILQYCKIIGTYVYLESREKSNEPIVETLAQLVTKPQSSNGCIECFNLIGWINIVPYIFVLSFNISRIPLRKITRVISTFLLRMKLSFEQESNEPNEPIVETLAQLVTKPQSSNGCIECCNLIGWINIVPHIFVLSFNIARLLVHMYT